MVVYIFGREINFPVSEIISPAFFEKAGKLFWKERKGVNAHNVVRRHEGRSPNMEGEEWKGGHCASKGIRIPV